jgi:rubrerythrin
MRKRIKEPTELGFSFAAVNCPSCGASFDARNEKVCPYCNTEYLHEEHDWIITDLK